MDKPEDVIARLIAVNKEIDDLNKRERDFIILCANRITRGRVRGAKNVEDCLDADPDLKAYMKESRLKLRHLIAERIAICG